MRSWIFSPRRTYLYSVVVSRHQLFLELRVLLKLA